MKPIRKIIPWSDAPLRNSRCVNGNSEHFHCLDCGANTHSIREYYMIDHDLWDCHVRSKPRIVNIAARDKNGKVRRTIQYKIQNEGMLCIGCLEIRIGRKLTSSDFTNYPVNLNPEYQRSVRLQYRMMAPGNDDSSDN